MSKLEDIFDEESEEKATLIYALVALKMVAKVYHKLPENIQQMVDDATTYWTNNEDFEVSEEQMDAHKSYISKLRWSSKNRYDMSHDLELKTVALCLSTRINQDFDYHVDWMYEVGKRIGFYKKKLDNLINETIDEYEQKKQ